MTSQRSGTEDLSSEKFHVFRSSSGSWDTTLKWQGFIGAYDPFYLVADGSLTINCMIQVDHERRNEDTVLIEKMLNTFFTIFFFILKTFIVGCYRLARAVVVSIRRRCQVAMFVVLSVFAVGLAYLWKLWFRDGTD